MTCFGNFLAFKTCINANITESNSNAGTSATTTINVTTPPGELLLDNLYFTAISNTESDPSAPVESVLSTVTEVLSSTSVYVNWTIYNPNSNLATVTLYWNDRNTASSADVTSLEPQSAGQVTYSQAISIVNDTIFTLVASNSTTKSQLQSTLRVSSADEGLVRRLQREKRLKSTTQPSCQAFVIFNGTSTTIQLYNSYNVSTVTKTRIGQYTINFANPMNSPNYFVSTSASQNGANDNGNVLIAVGSGNRIPTVSQCPITTSQYVNSAVVLIDFSRIYVAIFDL